MTAAPSTTASPREAIPWTKNDPWLNPAYPETAPAWPEAASSEAASSKAATSTCPTWSDDLSILIDYLKPPTTAVPETETETQTETPTTRETAAATSEKDGNVDIDEEPQQQLVPEGSAANEAGLTDILNLSYTQNLIEAEFHFNFVRLKFVLRLKIN
jgi:hypothetical protein